MISFEKTSSVSETEIAWLAGLLEGEGYFSISKNKTRGKIEKYPTITLAMNDKDVVERCANFFGTKTSPLKARKPTHQIAYRCLLRGSGAIEWMRKIYPFMGTRRQQKISEIISEWEGNPRNMKKSRIKRHSPIGFLSEIKPYDTNELAVFVQPTVG